MLFYRFLPNPNPLTPCDFPSPPGRLVLCYNTARKMSNIFSAAVYFFVQPRPVSNVPPGRGVFVFFFFPWLKPMGYGQPVPPGRFFFPPLFPRKRGGQGVSLRELAKRYWRKVRNVLFIFSLRPWRPLRFQGKSVKMNVDDPVNSCPHLFRFIDL